MYTVLVKLWKCFVDMDDLQAAYDRLLFDLVISGEGAGQEAKNILMTTDLAQSNSCPAFFMFNWTKHDNYTGNV